MRVTFRALVQPDGGRHRVMVSDGFRVNPAGARFDRGPQSFPEEFVFDRKEDAERAAEVLQAHLDKNQNKQGGKRK